MFKTGDFCLWEGSLCLFLGYENHLDVWILPLKSSRPRFLCESEIEPCKQKDKLMGELAEDSIGYKIYKYKPHEE